MKPQPLIELAEGKDQDDRSSLLSAFFRIMRSHRRREISDLHVRELLTYVLVNNRDGRGVQMSYDEVANVLCCERSTARSIIHRAVDVYQLLAVTEDRYARGGQAPNRYSVDWQAVRRINSQTDAVSGASLMPSSRSQTDAVSGVKPAATRVHPGDTTVHPPATIAQGAATTAHPYKEYTLSLIPNSNSAAAKAAAEMKALDWDGTIIPNCTRLQRGCRALDADFIWTFVVCAESIAPGMASESITRVLAGVIAKPRGYLEAALRNECRDRGINLLDLKSMVPPRIRPAAVGH